MQEKLSYTRLLSSMRIIFTLRWKKAKFCSRYLPLLPPAHCPLRPLHPSVHSSCLLHGLGGRKVRQWSPNLFGTRDKLCGRQTVGRGGRWFKHYIYCAPYFYYYYFYLSSTSYHQALDPGGWGYMGISGSPDTRGTRSILPTADPVLISNSYCAPQDWEPPWSAKP